MELLEHRQVTLGYTLGMSFAFGELIAWAANFELAEIVAGPDLKGSAKEIADAVEYIAIAGGLLF